MSDTVLASLIGAFGTIVAPIIALLIRRSLDLRKYMVISHRQQAINGKWEGMVRQNFASVEDDREYEIEIRLKTSRKTITGEGHFGTPKEMTHITLFGGFVDDWYVQISYKDKNQHIIRYGTAFLKLSSDGRGINGKYVAYAAEEEGLVTGSVELVKHV